METNQVDYLYDCQYGNLQRRLCAGDQLYFRNMVEFFNKYPEKPPHNIIQTFALKLACGKPNLEIADILLSGSRARLSLREPLWYAMHGNHEPSVDPKERLEAVEWVLSHINTDHENDFNNNDKANILSSTVAYHGHLDIADRLFDKFGFASNNELWRQFARSASSRIKSEKAKVTLSGTPVEKVEEWIDRKHKQFHMFDQSSAACDFASRFHVFPSFS